MPYQSVSRKKNSSKKKQTSQGSYVIIAIVFLIVISFFVTKQVQAYLGRGKTVMVTIDNLVMSPKDVSIIAGDTIRVVNTDDLIIPISVPRVLENHKIGSNKYVDVAFKQSGSYKITSNEYPFLSSIVTVQEKK